MTTEDAVLQAKVSTFAEAVVDKLKRKGRGVGWHRTDPRWLLMRLRQEVEELEYAVEAMDGTAGYGEVRDECYDVAAFAMMLWDRIGNYH